MLVCALAARKAWSANTIDQEIEIFPDEPIGVIRPDLHGQFVSYPSPFIDGGLWVGRDSKIPNVNGFRETAVEELSALGVPMLRGPEKLGPLDELIGARPFPGGPVIPMDPVTEESILHYKRTALVVETNSRTAVNAGVSLNVLQRQADKVLIGLAPLDALLTMKNGGCFRTPVYYMFLLAKAHRGNMSVKADPPQASPRELSISASRRDNLLVITVANPRNDVDVRVRCVVRGHRVASASAKTVTEYSTGVPQKVNVQVRPEGMLLELSELSVTTIRSEMEA
jgi:alpha-L-arabinofuranosidase